MSTPLPIQRVTSIAVAAAVAAALMLDIHHALEGPIAQAIGAGVQSAMTAGVALDPHRRAAGDTAPGLLVGLGIGLTIAGALGLRLRRRSGRRVSRWAAGLITVVLTGLPLDTLGYGAAVAVPLATLVVLLPVAALLAVRHTAAGGALIDSGFWAGLAWLVVGGGVLLADPAVDRHHLMSDHAQLGLIWTPFLAAWSIDHLLRVDGERTDAVRLSGLLAVGLFLLEAASGIARMLLPGEALLASAGIHALLGGGALLTTTAHVVLRVQRRARTTPRRPEGRPRRVHGYVAAFAAVLSLHALWQPAAPPPEALASVQGGAVAHPLDTATLGDRQQTMGCGAATGCHAVEQAQWSGGAHQQAANPIYASVAARLAHEQGDGAVAQCAACHDPLTVLDGRAPHPVSADSEGVSCGVCHGLTPAPGEPGDGDALVAGDPAFPDRTRWQSTAYLAVKTDGADHAAGWRPAGLGTAEQCGTCHQLSMQEVPLRTTHTEWAQSGSPQDCTACHMPRTSDSGGRFRDHAMRSGHVGLPGLSPAERAARAAFLASAVDVDVELLGAGAEASVRLTMTNARSGHGFPTAPLDLVRYELQVLTDTDGWRPLHTDSLFPQTLRDAAGRALSHHELWRVASVSGVARIAPRTDREWRFPVPEGVSRPLSYRLMHWRVDPARVDDALAASGLDLRPVELQRGVASEARARR